MWLHFSSVNLASGSHLVVSPLNGSRAITVASPSSSVTTTPLSGSGISVQFVPPSKGCLPNSNSTFVLDSIGYSYSESEDSTVEIEERAICGSADTMKNMVCYSTGSEGDKTIVSKAKAVMRTQRTREDNAIVTCTAWLWGNQGHIISNNHCFSSQEMVDAAKFEFDVQTTGCSDDCAFATCPIGKTLVGKDNVKFIKSNATLDYSVLQITNDAASYVSSYGFLQIRNTAPSRGEEIYIPQHPKGGAKKITTTQDDAGSKAALVLNLDFSIAVAGVTYNHLIAYSADTEVGSSGAPVMSRGDNSVVGLHRIGDCNNAATPSDQLISALQAVVSGNDGIKTA
ncbi:Trypsin-like peptidase domain [Phytophthora infestans]|nr:Trypsin-like peptidase domain [Phytophthora infestans]KAF4141197.1 Trypsin-like peptidase domain [Phytophthora infestans]KAF4142059.1 Trypsin-like peptidase domain [Phytophthora infestans]